MRSVLTYATIAASLALAASALASSLSAHSQLTALQKSAARTAPASANEQEGETNASVASLERRLFALETARALRDSAGKIDATQLADEVDALRRDIAVVMAQQAITTEAGREALNRAVADAQARTVATRREAVMAERDRWLDDSISTLVKEARLNPTQESEIRNLLERENEARRAPADDTPETILARRAKLRELRTQTDATVKKLLSEDQFVQFQKLRGQQASLMRRG